MTGTRDLKKFFTFMAALAAITFANASARHIGPVANIVDPVTLQVAPTYQDAIRIVLKKDNELRFYLKTKEPLIADGLLIKHVAWMNAGAPNKFIITWIFEQTGNGLWYGRRTGVITVEPDRYSSGGGTIDGFPGEPFSHPTGIEDPLFTGCIWANEPGGACEGHLNP